MLTLVEGEKMEFGFVLENQLVGPKQNPEVAGYLNAFEATVFPQGSIHYQFNNNCKPATFVAALNSEDPGTSQIAQNFFALNSEVVDATLGFPVCSIYVEVLGFVLIFIQGPNQQQEH